MSEQERQERAEPLLISQARVAPLLLNVISETQATLVAVQAGESPAGGNYPVAAEAVETPKASVGSVKSRQPH